MNEQIRISPVRLIGVDGEQLGIVPTMQAQELAREAGVDLVEISATERPPVCKLMDYGKHKYAQSKKAHQKTHQQKLKELRVRPKTGDHDVDTRLNQARGFLADGDKVQIMVQFRGREMQHIEEGRRIIEGMLEKLADCCKIEKPPVMQGKQMTALLAPKSIPKPPSVKSTNTKPSAPKMSPEQVAVLRAAAAAKKAAEAGAEGAAVPAPVPKVEAAAAPAAK